MPKDAKRANSRWPDEEVSASTASARDTPLEISTRWSLAMLRTGQDCGRSFDGKLCSMHTAVCMKTHRSFVRHDFLCLRPALISREVSNLKLLPVSPGRLTILFRTSYGFSQQRKFRLNGETHFCTLHLQGNSAHTTPVKRFRHSMAEQAG